MHAPYWNVAIDVGRCIYRLFDASGLDHSQFLLKIFHGIAPAVFI